jgi:predicted RNA binding protein YcfA (HicA-like mRNA interferase family)
MKRRDFENHLRLYGCGLVREGAKHSVYKNLQSNYSATVPRHREIWPDLAKKICRQLDIPLPKVK